MNKKIFLLVLITGLLFLNLTEIKNFFHNYIGNSYFEKESFDKSIKEFEKSKNIYGYYDKANSLYKKGKYEEAIKEYVSILNDENNKINFKINHNLGNSYYRLGEQDEQNKLNYWQKSVDYYKKALEIIYDEETKQNLEFVLNKINDEKNSEEQESGNDDNPNSNEESGSGSQDKNSDGTNDNSENGNEKDGNQNNNEESSDNKDGGNSQNSNGEESNNENGQDSNGENNSEEESALDKGKTDAIKQYEESLKEIQKQNGEYFNKVYEGGTNDIFNNMFNDPFFDNSLLNDDTLEKDW